MAQLPDTSERPTEALRAEVAVTRAGLADKLEVLEQTVMDAVADATSAVGETVDSVKQSVDDTVQQVTQSVHQVTDSLKRTFDVRRIVDRHPWTVMAAAVAAGYALGRLLRPRRGA